MKRYRIFRITTIKETNTKPIRIKIVDLWKGGTAIIGYSAEGSSNRTERAIEFLKEKGIEICAESYMFDNSECFLLTEDFKTEI